MPPGLGMRFLPAPDTTDIHYHLTNRLTTPTPTQTCPSATADATGRFYFFGIFLPPKIGGGVGWGRAARQGKRDKYRNDTE